MKKLILLLGAILFVAQTVLAADVMPRSVGVMDVTTLGVYQAPEEITLYQEPSETSPVVNSIKWSDTSVSLERVGVNGENEIKFEDLFVVFLPEKKLAYVAVYDETEDWVQIVYDNKNGRKGWMKKDDPYKFLTWLNFYNMYGRKYGLYLLKGAPDAVKDMRSGTEDLSQIVAEMNFPQGFNGAKIKLNAIRGNWMLVSVFDADRQPKTGYIRWRSNDGIKYVFPAIK